MKKKITTVTTTVTEEVEAPKKTYLALVLDESSSMNSVKSDTIGGFNAAIASIKELADLGGETYVTLITFGTTPKVRLMKASAQTLEPLTDKNYTPNGWTAMLDGIGMAIESLDEYDEEAGNIAFKVTILTDGEENRSREWTGPKLAQKIQELEKRGNWTFEMIGANVSVERLKAMTGIQSTFSYDSSRVGTRSVFDTFQAANVAYMANRGMGVQSYSGFVGASASAGTLDASSTAMGAEMKKLADEQLAKLKAQREAEEQARFASLDKVQAKKKKVESLA